MYLECLNNVSQTFLYISLQNNKSNVHRFVKRIAGITIKKMISDSEDEFFKSLDIDNISNTVRTRVDDIKIDENLKGLMVTGTIVNNAIYQTNISMVAKNDAEYEQNVINYYIATSDLRSVDSEVHPTNKSTVDEKATAIDNTADMVDDSKVVEIAEGLIDSIFVENDTENAADQTDHSMVIEIEAEYGQSIINYYIKTQNAKDKCSVDKNAEYLTDNITIIENEADYQGRVISYYIATQDTDCDKNVINVASRKQCNDDDMCRGQLPKPKRKNWRKKPTRLLGILTMKILMEERTTLIVEVKAKIFLSAILLDLEKESRMKRIALIVTVG
ncbi:uncharacterized protein LOC123541044 [Mercenaria mercenaria]|uniref:uncharacterized protein LOC123541044 n=1 Tax=Mercenaria mercenaria TaxID=6596 RepID=UPI001E1D6FB7|nr:uncharacterized protein LOC123541044 [Mercenaria mercenaria]